MLEQGLNSPETQKRQGVCIGLSEIIWQTSRDSVLLYVDSLLPTIRSALCDAESDVRAAAAQTFDSLHSTVGKCTISVCINWIAPSTNIYSRLTTVS